MNKAESLFKDKGIPRVGTCLYTKQVAIDFINECKKLNIPILGIDAFVIGDSFTQPSIYNSIDFTATPYLQNVAKDVWHTATNFLKERDDQYYFEIVCSDSDNQ